MSLQAYWITLGMRSGIGVLTSLLNDSGVQLKLENHFLIYFLYLLVSKMVLWIQQPLRLLVNTCFAHLVIGGICSLHIQGCVCNVTCFLLRIGLYLQQNTRKLFVEWTELWIIGRDKRGRNSFHLHKKLFIPCAYGCVNAVIVCLQSQLAVDWGRRKAAGRNDHLYLQPCRECVQQSPSAWPSQGNPIELLMVFSRMQ